MKPRNLWRRGAVIALSLLASGAAFATTLTAMDLDEMSRAADTVVVGSVRSQQTVRDGNAINTVLNVGVTDAITGQPGATVQVVVPGGSIESNGFRVGEVNAGITAYGFGSQVVFFLTAADAAGQRRIVGYSQGQFNVTGGKVMSQDMGGAVTLDQFKARIRANATR